ncbi:FliR family flagellar biosynthesis protein [Buttiauxella ferragutiae ATCC 51602]|jgi:flagellar biosynthetic protein FliR|uniref:Flagellar biosynthetic protein FliR n=1 Tax=Buttiauxella ferragutiae ATCC 51602 TaxID=1354252 RepID=A0ABX2W8U0_9ENTR|nr:MULTISPECIES: flagellar biosynthetic protein FliR [Buttiauxella]OAT28088.1 FliR family flagellar biosynthesis protein [Buttiauxella ferragutiae ATCC 51602]TDN49792.1 flagellar biosynthetic protein FliR [Buttiauxella sp. JUb87]
MLEITAAELLQAYGRVWWPFLRIGSAFAVLPLLGYPLIPIQVRVMLALLIAVLAAPMLPAMPAVDPLSLHAVFLSIEQIVLGAMMALFPVCLIQVLVLVGELLSMQMGLSMARMNDPVNGLAIPVLGSFFSNMGLLLYASMNGHLVMLEILVESFRIWTVGDGLFNVNSSNLIQLFSWVLAASLMLSLPAMVAMYLVNLTFGVLSRVAPSLNIFVLGFPMALVCGLFCILLTISGLPDRFADLAQDIFLSARGYYGGAK